MNRQMRTRRLLFGLLAVSLLLDGGAIAVVLTRDAPPVAQPGSQLPDYGANQRRSAAFLRERAERTQQVRALLDRRARALMARDRAGFLATVDPTQTAFLARQQRLYDALVAVPLASWDYLLDEYHEAPPEDVRFRDPEDEVWAPDVTLRYQLSGFDPEPNVLIQRLAFVRRDEGWLIADQADLLSEADSPAPRELWDFGPVDVVRGQRSLVIGRPGRRALLTQLSRQVDQAVPAVTKVWGGVWAQSVVVLVPGSSAELGMLISESSDLSQIAAVAIANLGGEQGRYRAVGNRIVVNPTNFLQLGSLGRQIVLRHEITHVASRALTSASTPTWLVEGFADYVGYLASGVPVRVVAKELRAEVRAGKAPETLPVPQDFAGSNPRLSLAYEAAWMACRMIAERTSQATLVRFYKAVGGSTAGTAEALSVAMRDILGTTPLDFSAAWRAYVRAQLA